MSVSIYHHAYRRLVYYQTSRETNVQKLFLISDSCASGASRTLDVAVSQCHVESKLSSPHLTIEVEVENQARSRIRRLPYW